MPRRFVISCFMASLLLADPASAQMTVDEAYKAIPHPRTLFQAAEARSAGMTAQEARSLEDFFRLVDRATVLRVSNMMKKSSVAGYVPVIKALEAWEAPEALSAVKARVVNAVRDQQQYFQNPRPGPLHGNALVRSSSRDLRAAYGELMRLYPNQGQNNKTAFFDYLCALDFI
jgi:hypothetical protein